MPLSRSVTFWLSVVIGTSLAIFFVALILWSGVSHWLPASAAPSKAANAADMEQALKEKLETYGKRADDLQKLISLLLGLSTIYAIALGLSSYAGVQNNLQQAEKWVANFQTMQKEQREQNDKSFQNLENQAGKSVQKLKELLSEHEELKEKFLEEQRYASAVALASGSLALALQGKYLGDAELAVSLLLELRSGRPTDRYVNLFLGRLYKALKRYSTAEEAMTSFIKRKEDAKEDDDVTSADAYYNRACYRSLRWETVVPGEKEQLRNEITADLTRSIRLDETNKQYALDDPDFDSVKAEPWFEAIISP